MKRFLSYLRNHYSEISKIFLFLISVVILVLVFPKEGKFKYEFTKGKPWMHEDLIAPFDFAILKSEEEIEKEKAELLKDQKPYFKRTKEEVEKQRQVLIRNFTERWEGRFEESEARDKDKRKNLDLAVVLFDTVMNTGVVEQIPALDQKPDDYNIYKI